MIAFSEFTHIDMWDVVEKDNHIALDVEKKEISRDKWMNDHKSIFLLNSCARNALSCVLSQVEYSKVHSFRSVKHMWDTLAITYEGSFEVKHNKLSLLTRKNSLVDIQTMFERFKTILNELGSLSKHYDNYDHIDKIL